MVTPKGAVPHDDLTAALPHCHLGAVCPPALHWHHLSYVENHCVTDPMLPSSSHAEEREAGCMLNFKGQHHQQSLQHYEHLPLVVPSPWSSALLIPLSMSSIFPLPGSVHVPAAE
ncbi:hypothetical protein AGIG_G23044 [Arapaima gigas]